MEKLNKEHSEVHFSYVIIKQHFTADRNHTIYTIKNNFSGEIFEMLAQDAYSNDQMLHKFSPGDIRNICYSAIIERERTITLSLLK